MKTIYKFQYILIMLCGLLFSGCLKDGDETIALENGQVEKMILGRWLITTPKGNLPSRFKWTSGTSIIFYEDGTFTDSSDGHKTRHKWYLGNGGGIYFDGYHFGYPSWGRGKWILQYPYGSEDPTWESELDYEDGGEEVEEPEEEKGVYRVKSITADRCYSSSSCTYTFTYNDDGSIKTFYDGYSNTTYNYTYSSGQVTINSVGTTKKSSNTYSLNTNGAIQSDVNGTYSYTTSGYLSAYKSGSGYEIYTWSSTDYSKKSTSYAVEGKFCSESNNSNIDLNPFVLDWNVSLAPFGFLGNKSSYVVYSCDFGDFAFSDTKVVRNDQDYISKITHVNTLSKKTETFDIEYEYVHQ